MKRGSQALSDKEIRERGKNNLCFFCDEKFVPGHRCRWGQFKSIEVRRKVEDEEEEFGDAVVEEGEVELALVETSQISTHALTGESAYQTMSVTGIVKGRPLHILIKESYRDPMRLHLSIFLRRRWYLILSLNRLIGMFTILM
ncbi:hypothetical protein Droror1_Dr00024858 [Drosera rotundifolia]